METEITNTLYRLNGLEWSKSSRGGQLSATKKAGVYKYVGHQDCTRCGGRGGWSGWPGFTCYRCGGCCVDPNVVRETVYTAAALPAAQEAAHKRSNRAAEKRAAEAAEARAKAEAAFAVWAAPLAEDLASVARLRGRNPFLADLADRLDSYVTLSARMLEAAKAQIARIDAEDALRAATADRPYIGEVGDRVEFAFTTVRVVSLPAFHVTSWRAVPRSLVIGRDADGRVVVWKTGSYDYPDVGQTRMVRATVAETTDYNGTPQTVISRPKWAE